MKKHNLAFVDIETTGLDPEHHEIIEIGCLVARQVAGRRGPGRGPELEIVSELDLKVKPEHLATAEPEALRINGYSDADWLFASTLSQAMKVLSEKMGDAIVIAQNVSFDWSFLQKAFTTTGVPTKVFYYKLDLGSIALAKLYDDERAQRFNLAALTDYCQIKNGRAHTALADVRTSFEIYKKLMGA